MHQHAQPDHQRQYAEERHVALLLLLSHPAIGPRAELPNERQADAGLDGVGDLPDAELLRNGDGRRYDKSDGFSQVTFCVPLT